jgi:hypothetical protein
MILIGISALIFGTRDIAQSYTTRTRISVREFLHHLQGWPWRSHSWASQQWPLCFSASSRGAHFDFLQQRLSIRKTPSVKCSIYRGAMVTNI